MNTLGTCAILLCALGQAGPVVVVRPVTGAPAFVVDGAPFFTPCFETYVPTEYYFRQFAEAGVKVFTFNTNAAACDYGHSKATWLDEDTWDYTGFDERCDRVLAACPDALILPRVNLGTPRWWLEAHPETLEVLHTGKTHYETPNTNPTVPRDRGFPSLASRGWRHDIGDALARFIDHVQASAYGNHIFGYMLTGLDTEEWYHWSSGSNQLAGYSEPTQAAFRRWLRKKYPNDEVLQAAWRQPDATLDTAGTPSYAERWDHGEGTFRDPATKTNVVDFYTFYNELIPETIEYFADIAREKTQGRKVVGAFYGYMYEFCGNPEFGHNALGRFLKAESLDFMFVTASYRGRAFGSGGEYARCPAYSVRLHGKLWYHDNDVVSFLAPEVMKRVGLNEEGNWSTSAQHHLNVLGYTETPQETCWMYRRSMGFALCNGAYESYFDLHGGYYDHPELMAEVKRLNRLADQAVAYDRHSNSEILVVADEESCAWATFQSPLLDVDLAHTQQRLIKIGAPADHILLSALEDMDVGRYKLVVFLNCYKIPQSVRATIQRKLMRDGRHLLWCYAPGYYDEAGRHEAKMAELTELPIRFTEDAAPVNVRLHMDGVEPGRLEVSGAGAPSRRLAYVECPGLNVIATHAETGKPALAWKDRDGWRSIYALTSDLPPFLYRQLAREAGVHIYNERDDTLYVNRSFLCLHANGAGPRSIRFPEACNVADLITGKVLAEDGDHLARDFANGETLLIRWQAKSQNAAADPN